MKKILNPFVYILCMATCVADPTEISPQVGSVASANASYDGNALVLKGDVLLDHGLGKMKADEALLTKQEAGKDFPFSVIHLQKAVELSLQNQGYVKCEEAHLDFETLKGTLSSSSHVLYQDVVKRKKGEALALQLMSKNIDLLFSIAKEGTSKKTPYEIDVLTAREAVQIVYAGSYTLLADEAVYKKNALATTPTSDFQSTLSAYPLTNKGVCRLQFEKSWIDADRIEVDLLHAKLVLAQPKGVFEEEVNHKKTEAHFSSETLLLDHTKNSLSLKNNVELDEPSLGHLSSKGEVVLIQKKGELHTLTARGKTHLTYLNKHTLTSFGTLHIDKQKLHATLDSPLVEGNVPSGKQLVYKEGELTLVGNKGNIEYTQTETGLHPISLSLKGDIRLFSQEAHKPLRIGIADRVTYSPTTRTFILGANPGKKVLFVNQEDNLRVSAQEVHITEDPVSKKQVVKGLGNVQLAFTPEEEALLDKLFNFQKELP